MLTDKQIQKFQRIYHKHFGKEISKEDVLDRGIKLIRLIQHIHRPITKQETQKYIKPSN